MVPDIQKLTSKVCIAIKRQLWPWLLAQIDWSHHRSFPADLTHSPHAETRKKYLNAFQKSQSWFDTYYSPITIIKLDGKLSKCNGLFQ